MNVLSKIKKYFLHVSTAAFVFLLCSPILISAATGDGAGNGGGRVGNLGNKNFQELVKEFILLAMKYTLTLLVGLTVLMFAFGLMKYMFKGQSSDTARSEGRQLMLWGVIGLFVMTSVWGLVAIMASLIGHQGVLIPQFR